MGSSASSSVDACAQKVSIRRLALSKRPLLWLAVACQVVLSTLYLLWLPAHEGPDENDHCYYAYYLQSSGRLPTILNSAQRTGRAPWEEASVGHHPPLYYALLAATMSLLGGGDNSPAWRGNLQWIGHHPDWRGDGDAWAFEHSGAVWHWTHGADEVAPVSPEITVLRWLRAWSVLLGTVSVVLTYALGRLLFPQHRLVAGVAALWLACVPQWSMMHGCLDNGNLAAACSHGVLVVLVWAIRRGWLGYREGVALGALCAAAVLAKLTAIFLVPLVGGVFAVRWWVERERRVALALAAVTAAAVFAAVCGWVFVRNATLYGDPLAMGAHGDAFASNAVPDEKRWGYLFGEFPWRTLRSGIGVFGWSVLPVPGWVHASFVAVLVLGALGCVGGAARLRRAAGPALWVPVAAIALAGAGFVRFNMLYFQPQGRYLFPVYGALMVLVVAGLMVPLPALWKRLGRAGAVLIAAPPVVAIAVFGLHFAPAFAVVPGLAEPWYASMIAGAHTPAPEERATIEALEPADGARLAAGPTFRWRAPEHDADARYSLHFYSDSGRVIMTTYEWGGVLIEGQEWTFPDAVWKSIAAGDPFYWKVRRLPDRSAGETVEDVPESAPRRVTRVE